MTESTTQTDPAASILDSTKKKLGLGSDYDAFDLDIVDNINAAFMNLNQLGIGPVEGFQIEDATATWNTFLGAPLLLNSVKSFIQFKVKLAFDPPATSFHIAAIEKQIQELEWRMTIMREELMAADAGVVTPVLPEEPVVQEPFTTMITANVDGGGADM